jgi:hypothetical protein
MAKIQTEHFEFLNPRSKTEFGFFGAAAGAIVASHSKVDRKGVWSEDYSKLVTEFLEALITDPDAPPALYKTMEKELNQILNQKLSEKTAAKQAKVQKVHYVNVDGEGDFDSGSEDDAPVEKTKPAAAAGAAAADDEEEEVVDEVLEGPELQAKLALEREREKQKQVEEEKQLKEERARLLKIEEENATRNAKLAERARTAATTTVPSEFQMLAREDDEFGAFGGKNKKGGKKR